MKFQISKCLLRTLPKAAHNPEQFQLRENVASNTPRRVKARLAFAQEAA